MNVQVSLADDSDSIEVFQDLELKLRKDDNADVRLALTEAATPPWEHAKERETTISLKDRVDHRTLTFERREGNGFVRVWISLFPYEDGYRVVNILPVTETSISMQICNRVIHDFVSRVVAPASERSTFEYSVSAGRMQPEDWLGEKAGSALKRFSHLANRGSGNSHPLDWERWMNFVTEASKCEKPMHSDLTERWLREVEGWSEEFASSLTIDYIKGVDLLRYSNGTEAGK